MSLGGDLVAKRIVTPLAASVDRLVMGPLVGRSARGRRRSATESLGPGERARLLGAIERAYAATPLDDVDGFFGVPLAAPLDVTPAGTRRLPGGEQAQVLDARWPSRTATFLDDPELARRFAATAENATAAARLFLGPARPGGRPAVIVVHGYRSGIFAVEEWAWPVKWLLGLGLDVALFALPFHGVRRAPGSPHRFPASDPRFTNEGFRQAIGDLRGLVRALRRRGAPTVGAMGMSLGGYTVSLLATVDPELAFAVPVIPLASLPDVARATGRFVGTTAEQQEQHERLEAVHRVVSPLARPGLVAPDAVVVIAGEGDRITPPSHAHRLARHLGGELVMFPGGHLMQWGRRVGFRAVARMLRRRGVIA